MEITKEELKDLYYTQNLTRIDICKLLNISKGHFVRLCDKYSLHKNKEQIQQRFKQTCLERYDVEAPMQNKNIKNKAINTCINKWGVDNYTKTSEYKEIVSKAYSTGIPQQKWINTRKALGSLSPSRKEDIIYEILTNHFGVYDVERQYNDTRYSNPENNKCFDCDFYIKSLDLFIEYNGNWCHGKIKGKYLGPYNPDNKEHQEMLEYWRYKDKKLGSTTKRSRNYYTYAIKVWTITDPLKRRIAKQNNLNWLEFFTIEEVESFLNNGRFTKVD